MSITLTNNAINTLKKKGIRVDVAPDSNLKFPDTPFGFERYTNHLGSGFMPLGAYSYSHSHSRDVSRIGRYCSIGNNLKVIRNTHPMDHVSSSPVFYSPRKLGEWGGRVGPEISISKYEAETANVSIDHDVWIGGDVSIRSGVHIGTGAIIAAGSIVTKDVEPYSIVAGIPAKMIKYRFDAPLRQQLLATQWWQYTPQDLLPFKPENPEDFVASFAQNKDSIQPLPEVRLRPRQHLRR